MSLPSSLGPALASSLSASFGSPPCHARAVGGGDVNEAFEVRLEEGRALFLKVHRAAPDGFFEAEADGLEWLREPSPEAGGPSLRVPEVLGIGRAGELAWLALEALRLSRGRSAPEDEALGVGLARLHRRHPGGFGAVPDGFIATLPQDNRPAPTWGAFYAERRLRPLFARLRRSARFDAEDERALERLCARLDEIFPEEPPARLHGDLWAGNAGVDETGCPVVFDPAVYGGHREMDLAMMRLFGGFGERTFEAYDAVHPRAPGHEARVPVAQLYPLLVHAVLFGAGYDAGVRRALRPHRGR